MKPSDYYRDEMFVWKKSRHQIQLMLKEKCKNDFTIIKPNI